MNVPQLMWAVGLFEGEGCITHGRNHFVLKLAMTDKDIVDRFAELMGVGNVHEQKPQKEGYKTQYCWRIQRKAEIIRILDMFLPHLGHRRAHKALDVLDYLECT